MKTIALVNPNTSDEITSDMLEIARCVAAGRLRIEGLTARFGVPLITRETDLEEAERAVVAFAPDITADAVIVSAFGDPGADRLAALLNRPVVGIAEAAMRAAAQGGRRFAVVTTTPGLARSISARAQNLGLDALCGGVLTTQGDAAALMRSPGDLERALRELAVQAVARLGVETIVVGGGPLGRVARALRNSLSFPVVEPIPEAVRHVAHRLGMSVP